MTTTTLLTIDDFERLPADVAEGHELVDGELVDVSGNIPLHNGARDYLIEILRPFARKNQLGVVYAEQEYDFLGNAHGPDVSFFGASKLPLLDKKKRVQRFVPDLAIEIASASDTYDGLLLKRDRYLRAGTAEVWLVSTESREIAVYFRDRAHIFRGADTIATGLLPGFCLSLEELFREI